MNDTEFYRQRLGLVAPWEVSRVDLSAKEDRIDVWLFSTNVYKIVAHVKFSHR
jgi:hypothetical protein